MKTNTSLTFATLLISLVVFISCEKENLSTNVDDTQLAIGTSNGIEVNNGILKFSTMGDFENAINQVTEDGEYYKKFSSDHFTSLKAGEELKLQTKSTDNSEAEEDTLVVSDAFASVVNEEREIIVADNLYKVSQHGTFISTEANLEILRELDSVESIEDLLEPAEIQTRSMAPVREPLLYKLKPYDDIYVYDTFNRYSAGANNASSSTSEPDADDFEVTSFKGTLIGKAIDGIFGFSKSVRNYFDSDHRMDAKFYDVNYGGLHQEMGVKTKTQKKGWTSLWRKQDVSEIRSGYRVLAVKENLKNSFLRKKMPDDFIKNLAYVIADDGYIYYYLGYGFTELRNGTYLTLNFYKKDPTIDYNLLKKLIRFAQNTGIENFNNYNTDGKVAVRFVDNVAGVQKTILCMLNQEKVGTNTDKVTYIVDKKSAGVKITLKFSSDFSDFTATPGYINVKDNLEYYDGTQMYGVAKRDGIWKGVLFKF